MAQLSLISPLLVVFYSKDGFFSLHLGCQDGDAASGHNHVPQRFLREGDDI